MSKIILIFIINSLVAVAFGKDNIICRNKNGGSDVVVTLSDFKKFKRSFNCISGDFVVDLSGCAPNGAFGLHSPTGGADLVRVVDRWQDYVDHYGGITGNYVTKSEIYFSGGFNTPAGGYKEDWSFLISRLSGSAKLKKNDRLVGNYECSKAKKKF
jgi:hypothetical protein